jgi:two-component system LytT family sensor kinase
MMPEEPARLRLAWASPIVPRLVIPFCVATVLAVFFATRDHLVWNSSSWSKALWWKAMEWYAWALLSPLVFAVCRRWSRVSWSRYLVVQLLAGCLFSLAHVAVCATGARLEAGILHTGRDWLWLFGVTFRNHFHFDLFVYAALVCLWHAVHSYQQHCQAELSASRLKAELAQAQLLSLRTQLQPHFLFNTLHSIAALNYDDPKAANRMIARLSNLLRLTLESRRAPEISLQEELDVLGEFLEIEQVRFGDRLKVEKDICPSTLDAAVPTLLLQPIVENAIKHGIAPFSAPGRIRISSAATDGKLRLTVQDSGRGFPKDANGSGVGLANTRERLRCLFGREHALDIATGDPLGCSVSLCIPLKWMRRTE